jgi:ankyrin repeat protein
MNPAIGMSTKTSFDRFYQELQHQIRDGAYPLHMALARSCAPMYLIQHLAEEGKEILVKTNKFGETPLHVALSSRASDAVIQFLLRLGPNALRIKDRTNGNLPIHVAAASKCSCFVAQMLVALMTEHCRELMTERNGAGLTPLEMAVQGDLLDVIHIFSVAS